MPNRKKLTKKLIKKIKDLIESGTTNISTICSLTGISRSVWYKWEAEQNGHLGRLVARARTRAREREDEKLVCETKRGLLLLLQGYFYTETEHKTLFDNDGTPRTTTTVSLKHAPACTKTIIFVLENADKPNFQARMKRHVRGKMNTISQLAGKAGARILTYDEAFSMGLIETNSTRLSEQPELTNNHYAIRNMK